MATSLNTIPLRRIDGSETSLAQYDGSVLLIVNVASKCGLTPQYEALEDLYKTYRDKGLQVLGFPANDFGQQEPGTHEEIQEFCSTNYNVDFPLFAKISTKGAEQHPLYRALVEAKPTAQLNAGSNFRDKLKGYGIMQDNDTDVLWNFEKFLIDRKGNVVGRFAPDVAPKDAILIEAIEQELNSPAD